jgi:hypothetical protein
MGLAKFWDSGEWRNYIGTLQERDYNTPMLEYLKDAEQKRLHKEIVS